MNNTTFKKIKDNLDFEFKSLKNVIDYDVKNYIKKLESYKIWKIYEIIN